jgi:tetratricopeptide (TPR) repeat protein
LIREVLYEGLNAAERKSWHLRVGEALERRRASGREVANGELAHHFLSAFPRGDVVKAVNYASHAAVDAGRFFAFADASALLYRALQALQSTDQPDLHLLCSLLLNLSWAERSASDSRYLDHLNQAIKLASENGFSRLLASAGQRLVIGPSSMALPEARRVLEAAEKMLPEGDKPERAIVLAHLAWTPPYCMNTRRVDELLAQADKLARESNSILALTAVLRARLFFTGAPTDQMAAQAIAEELERSLGSQSELWVLSSIDIHVFRIITAMQCGDQEAVQEAINAFGALALNFKSAELAWHHQRMGIIQRMNAGDLVGIRDALMELRERAEKLPLLTWQTACDLDLGVLLSLTTDIRPLAAEFRDQLKIEESDTQSIWALKIQRFADLGLLSEAESALRRLSVALIYELPTDRSYLITLARLAVGSIATRAMEYVEALYQLLTPYAQYYAVGVSLHCEGSVFYFLGILARTLGRNREAVEHLENALVQNERFGLKAQVVRSRFELARTLACNPTRSARKRARSLLEQALKAARTLGLQMLFDDVERLLTELPSLFSERISD